MKSVILFSALATLSYAFPTTNLFERAAAPNCPAIPQIAPTGQLPPGTLSPAALVIVSQKHPNKAFPPSYKSKVTPKDKCTLTRFDIPASARNNTCSLTLFLGGCDSEQYEKGPGHIIFQGNTGERFPVPGQTTWSNKPDHAPPFTDAPLITLGNAYRLGGGPCDYKEGQAFASVGGMICSDDTTLEFEQRDGGKGKCPVGFHIIIT